VTNEIPVVQASGVRFGKPSDVEGVTNETPEASHEFSDFGSSRRSVRCLNYKLKRLNSMSDMSSGPTKEWSGLNGDIRCLKYELKKLKSMTSEVPVMKKTGFEFRTFRYAEEVDRDAKEADHNTSSLALRLADARKPAEGLKSAAEEALARGGIRTEVEETVIH
jgi:hypothetical protein